MSEHAPQGPINRFRVPGALEDFERRTAWPMMAVVVVSLLVLLAPVFVNLSAGVLLGLAALEWLLWLVFVAEYAVRLFIAVDRRGFMAHNVVDLLVVLLPMIPVLRSLRILRLLRIGVMGARVIDQSDAIIKRSNAKYAFMVAGLIVLLAAVMVYSVEHDASGSNIHSLTDALWWAATTVTTVSYGDLYPVSPEGQVVALVLMVVGIALFGLVSASLASLFVQAETKDEYEDLAAKINRLEDKIDRLSPNAADGLVELLNQEPETDREVLRRDLFTAWADPALRDEVLGQAADWMRSNPEDVGIARLASHVLLEGAQ